MKKFIISVLCVAVFFIGLSGLINQVGARFKSDEKALTLIRQAREAIGGDANINSVRSLTIIGKATKTFDFDGAPRTEQGDWELNLQLPNQLSKMLKLRTEGGTGNGEHREIVEKNVIVIRKGDAADKTIVMPESENGGGKKVVVIRKGIGEPTVLTGDAASGEPHKIIVNKDVRVSGDNGGKFHQNEFFRTTLSLLLTAPEGSDVTYIYAGESVVDGVSCEIVEAKTGESVVKLYLDKSSYLPRMMTFQSAKPMIFKFNKDADKQEKVIVRQTGTPEMAEFQVKFSDYRSVNGLQMPHKWTQTVGGKDDETIDVSSYEVNPMTIAEKFNREPQKIMIRTAKPQ